MRRLSRVASLVILMGLFPLAALMASALAAEHITGRASVIDGDTVVIAGTHIRLHGIDAPESRQTCEDGAGKSYRCGQVAALALSDRIGAGPIACEPKGTDRYGRTIGLCRKGGEDLGAWLVRQGNAVAYRQYATDYVPQEAAAKLARLGIWSGYFTPPSAWRRGERAMTAGALP